MHKAIVLAGWAAALVACGAPAEAHIVCHDGFQVVNGREISTPYCNDNYLAAVARQYGVKATDEAGCETTPASKIRSAVLPAATFASRTIAPTTTETTLADSQRYFHE